MHGAITPDDFIHLVWSNDAHEVVYSRTPLNSATQLRKWTEPYGIVTNSYYSNISADKDGILYVIYTTADFETMKNGIYYSISSDFGKTWSLSKTILEIKTNVPSTIAAQFIVDGRGRYHVVYAVRSITIGEYSALGYLRSTDAGKRWETPLTFSPDFPNASMNVIGEYSFGDDEIHLTYDLPSRLHQWSYDGGETWSQPAPIENGPTIGWASGGYNHLVKDSSGVLHVVFASAAGVYHSTWNGSSWGVAEQIDQPSFDPHDQQLVLCQGNRLSVSYHGNDFHSEIWYSEKFLDIPNIPQLPNPTPILTSTPTATLIEDTILITETPIPTKISIGPPKLDQQQSLLTVIIFPVISVILLISAALFIKIKHP